MALQADHALSLIVPYPWRNCCSNTLALRNKPFSLPGALSTLQSHSRCGNCHRTVAATSKPTTQHARHAQHANHRMLSNDHVINSTFSCSSRIAQRTNTLHVGSRLYETIGMPTCKAVERSSQILVLLQGQARHTLLTLCLTTALLLLQSLLIHVLIRVWLCILPDFWLNEQ